MLDSGADFGCDGLGLDEEEFGLGGRRLVGGLLVLREERCVGILRFSGLDCEGSGSRRFDLGKSGYDRAVGIADLLRQDQSRRVGGQQG